jgi:phosphopantetheinyl transferase
MLPEMDLINLKIASNGKPYFENERVHFSLSHCNGYAASVVSKEGPVGIDIEIIHERIKKVAHKFLHSSEYEKINRLTLNEQLVQFSLCWATKEAMYKMHEKLGIDFSKQLRIEELPTLSKGIIPATILSESIALEVEIHYEKRENFVWAVSVS